MAENNIREIQVMYLRNVVTDDGIRVQMVTRSVDAKDVFGDDVNELAEIKGFYIRLDWQPETPIEFVPRPYWMG